MAGEWDPAQDFLDSPRNNHAIMLALAGHYEDARAYKRSLRHLATSDRSRAGFARFEIEIKAALGDYRGLLDQLGNCQNRFGVLLSPVGCGIRVIRANLAIGDREGATAQLEHMRDTPVCGYLTAVANDDREFLARVADGSNPKNWMVHYRVLLDAERHDEAFAFWRNRFPHGSSHFLWDTLMSRTLESPELADMPGYQSLLAFYGITPAWRQYICEGLYELEPKTGIKPVCGTGVGIE